MTPRDIVRLAARHYPEEILLHYWDEKAGRPVLKDAGDSLAFFIVNELHSVYDSSATDSEQLGNAAAALGKAARELAKVRDGLSKACAKASRPSRG